MAEIIKEELNIEEFEIKEEIVSFKEEILLSSTVEDTCEDDIKKEKKGGVMTKKENSGIQGELNFTIFVFENYLKMSKTLLKVIK